MYRKPLLLAIALIAAVFGLILSPTSAESAQAGRPFYMPA